MHSTTGGGGRRSPGLGCSEVPGLGVTTPRFSSWQFSCWFQEAMRPFVARLGAAGWSRAQLGYLAVPESRVSTPKSHGAW